MMVGEWKLLEKKSFFEVGQLHFWKAMLLFFLNLAKKTKLELKSKLKKRTKIRGTSLRTHLSLFFLNFSLLIEVSAGRKSFGKQSRQVSHFFNHSIFSLFLKRHTHDLLCSCSSWCGRIIKKKSESIFFFSWEKKLESRMHLQTGYGW